ncbi:MAG: hypothetical protein ACRDUW_03175 [Pseudonocardiaceae bacterium]
MAVTITALAAIVAALIGACAVLYSKTLDRKNEVESRKATFREGAYDCLIAAGDAAWFYRTRTAVFPDDPGDNDVSNGADAANELFQQGLDLLKDHSKDFDARIPLLSSWYETAFTDIYAGPRSFDNDRDAMVNLRRHESGLRKRLEESRELPFFERLRAGQQIQRLPIGLRRVIRTTDGEIMIMGAGEELAQIMLDMANYQNELRDSRERARIRLRKWRDKDVWRSPEGDCRG